MGSYAWLVSRLALDKLQPSLGTILNGELNLGLNLVSHYDFVPSGKTLEANLGRLKK